VITLTVLTDKPQSPFYEQLLGKVDDYILHLRDKRGNFLVDKQTEKNIKYFINHVMDQPWKDHLLLGVLIYGDKKADPAYIESIITTINKRFKDIFEVFSLENMDSFDVENHMYQYLKANVLKEHTDIMRSRLLTLYKPITTSTKRWILSNLDSNSQTHLEKYLFNTPSFDSREFSAFQLSNQKSKDTRKQETDVLVNLLPQIRAEGNFRWNQVNRLRNAFLNAREKAITSKVELPFEFQYDEPDRIGERLYFRLWDKASFILHHKDKFGLTTLSSAQKRTGIYSKEKNHYFVEFIKTDVINKNEEADGFWFTEILNGGVFGYWHQSINDIQRKKKSELLLSWGYGEEGSDKTHCPFHSRIRGIISPNTFIKQQQQNSNGVLLDVEPLFTATTFGLLALDIFTTTGARVNELLQLTNTKECIKTLRVNKSLKYSFNVIPKGRDSVETFYISEQTMKLIQRVSNILKEHYGSEKIPSVFYRDSRKHMFLKPKPYFFQYNNKAFTQPTVEACLRFLMHGLTFESENGDTVVIKTHLLRHAFATEAVQRQKLPIDIVAKLLHQRDVKVTGYYSEPTPSQIAQSVSDLHDVIADYVDLDEVVLRSPEELQKELEEYKEKVGVFNNVLGGTCVTNFVCPTKMQCLGCQAKIPQPEKKHELEEVIELSKDMERRFTKMNLPVEVKKSKAMRKQARNELKEIELIEKYREEQDYEPHIRFDK
jgi:hypothetical protein